MLSYVGGGLMRFDTDSIIQTRRALYGGNIISFQTQEEMVEEMAKIVTAERRSNLLFWQATAMDDQTEREEWEEKLRTELEPFYEAVRAELERQVKACEKLPFYRRHIVQISAQEYPQVIEAGLRAIKSDLEPVNTFPVNVHIFLNVKKNQARGHTEPGHTVRRATWH